MYMLYFLNLNYLKCQKLEATDPVKVELFCYYCCYYFIELSASWSKLQRESI